MQKYHCKAARQQEDNARDNIVYLIWGFGGGRRKPPKTLFIIAVATFAVSEVGCVGAPVASVAIARRSCCLNPPFFF